MSNYNRRGQNRDNYNNGNQMTLSSMRGNYGRPQLYAIHPTSVKMIQKGNPWVTLDKYSEQFHPKEKFIVASYKDKPFALLLHDPRHEQVRARLWSREGNFQKQIKGFKNDLTRRLSEAFRVRKKDQIRSKRSNLYLVFGEADRLPGVFVQLLNDQILIQFYSSFWDKFKDFFVQQVVEQAKRVFELDIYKENIWLQDRSITEMGKQPPRCLDPNISFKKIVVDEFDCKYKISLGEFYDVGLYTDMAAIRESVTKLFSESKTVLNLFSYTGCFSIFALKQGAKSVTSVDLSEKYLSILEENIELNEDLDPQRHRTMNLPVETALNELQGEQFDLIVNDPPSSSTDGLKRTNALKEYEKQIPKMYKLLSENGKMLLFLNTHKVSKRKFLEKLNQIIEKHKLDLKVSKFYSLKGDCPAMPKFPQGNYLKGFLIERI